MSKIVRFTKDNWNRFFTHSKQQTTRSHPINCGSHPAYTGSRYKPILLGEILIEYYTEKKIKNLNQEDAIKDGFDTLEEFKTELYRLDREHKLTEETTVYLHKCIVSKGKKVE